MKNKPIPAIEHKKKLKAKAKHELALRCKYQDPGNTLKDLIWADHMEREATTALTPTEPIERGLGGEVVPPEESRMAGMGRTVKGEDVTSIEASIDRINLADNCGVYNMAFDAAEAIQPQNALEQMVAHQMAAAHKHAMTMIQKSSQQRDVTEMTRLANAAARLMDVYQKAMLTMNKIRKGGKQTVTVQHVQLNDGAQAIINGKMETGGSK